jgi:DNA-binding response OmpR family regulator
MKRPCAVVIEDDPKISLVYVDLLEHAGFDVVLDINGNQYATLLPTEPDLVILDLHLPFAVGTDILCDIRSKYPNVIIAVITADLIKAKSLPAKADHVLIKPVGVERLLRIAESVKGAS